MRTLGGPAAAGEFAASLHDMLSAAGVPAVARRWAAGDRAPGLALWRRLASLGVTGLAVPREHGGLAASPADLVAACAELGHHAVPGPVAESVAAVPALLAASRGAVPPGGAPEGGRPGGEGHPDGGLSDAGLSAGQAREAGLRAGYLSRLASGDLIATLAMPPQLPFAADAEAAGLILLAEAGTVRLARPRARHQSVDPARSLTAVTGTRVLAAGAGPAVSRARDLGALACAAQLLGAGRALLEASVRHAGTRAQFGRPVGAFQAVKHMLADVAIALEFAGPLLDAAALAVGPGSPATGPVSTARDVSAAKVTCSEAAARAARAALQVHGAIGYTAEHDLSLWLAKVRALTGAWGSAAWHRERILAELAKEGSR
jgi:alkylation response protein AidB-like acyl-CoA dehydrogenase